MRSQAVRMGAVSACVALAGCAAPAKHAPVVHIAEAAKRYAAPSKPNLEGRQGKGGRTHLMSPAMAAAAAVMGELTDLGSF